MKRYIAIIAVILGIILFAVIVKAVSDSYRVNKTTSSIINEQGSCKVVTNTSSIYDYFIPTKTLNEWNLFKTNKPASVSLSSCYQCPETSSIYDNQTTCDSACTQTTNCTESCTISTNDWLYDPFGVSSCEFWQETPSEQNSAWDCGGGVQAGTDTVLSFVSLSGQTGTEYCSSGPGAWCRHSQTTCTFSCPLSGGSACSQNTLYNTNGPYTSCSSGNCPSGQGGNPACTCQTNSFQTSNTCTYNSFSSGGNNYFECVYTATISPTGSASTCTKGTTCTTLP